MTTRPANPGLLQGLISEPVCNPPQVPTGTSRIKDTPRGVLLTPQKPPRSLSPQGPTKEIRGAVSKQGVPRPLLLAANPDKGEQAPN